MDFEGFDYILAMDLDNLEMLQHSSDEEHHAKISLFLDFSTSAKGGEVPDPYYGGSTGFERVLDLVEEASEGLLDRVRESL
jgi:protein-tyrosine phosphatase